MEDLHSQLGVGEDASPAEIRLAFRRWAASHHPDRGGDSARFAVVAAAVDRATAARPSVDGYRRTSTYAVRRWAKRHWQRRRHPRVH